MTMHSRSFAPQPATLDANARSVDAIVSTGADVPRGGFVERLPLENADLSRLVGAPVLDAHNAGSTAWNMPIWKARRGHRSRPRPVSRLTGSRSRFASTSARAGSTGAAGIGWADGDRQVRVGNPA